MEKEEYNSTLAMPNISDTFVVLRDKNMAKINVKDVEVSVICVQDEDYISLTDMLKAKDGEFFFSNWLRNRNTVEFLGIWEKLNKSSF